MIFCELGSSGFSRYSFMIILECSSQSFHASFETFSKTRLPISPLQGTRSRPGNSLPNLDRKSTRLNSSHGYISYAVFCLKKKKRNHASRQRHSGTGGRGAQGARHRAARAHQLPRTHWHHRHIAAETRVTARAPRLTHRRG